MEFSEELSQLIVKYYGTNEEMDAKSEVERSRIFLEVFKDVVITLKRDYQIVLQIIPIEPANPKENG